MKREIIRPLEAWDRQVCSHVELSAGMVISDYAIIRGRNPSEEPYLVDFRAAGKQYCCALPAFLPRTRSLAALEGSV